MIALCIDGHLKEALEILHVMDQWGILLGSERYASLLDTYAKMKALEEGKQSLPIWLEWILN